MYWSKPRILKGTLRAEEAKNSNGIPVATPERRIRIVVPVLLVKLVGPFPRMRRRRIAGIRRVVVSIVRPLSGPAGATFLINP